MNKTFKNFLPLNLQLFAEGDPEPTPAPSPQPNPQPTPAPTPSGKVWTDEYVSGLRAEAKDHRLAKQAYEKSLRALMGLKPEDELNDSVIASYQSAQQKALSDALTTANNRLIAAEIKTLQKYDTKLIDKLIDRSKLTIEADGTVKGLTEQITELEKEFPAIKVAAGGGGAVNPGAGGGKTELQQLEEEYAKATNAAQRIAIKNKIHALQIKQT